MKRLIATSILGAFVPLAAHAATPLPEYHGLYVLDRGKLTELEDNLPEEKRRNFSAKASFVIYGPGARRFTVKLKKRVFIRSEIELVMDKLGEGGQMIGVNEVPINEIKLIPEEVELRVKPVPEKPDMIILVPRDPLKPGLYSIVAYDRLVGSMLATAPIAVGLGNKSEKDSPHKGCQDQTFITVAKSGQNWDTFNLTLKGGPNRRKMIGENVIVDSMYALCRVWDEAKTTERIRAAREHTKTTNVAKPEPAPSPGKSEQRTGSVANPEPPTREVAKPAEKVRSIESRVPAQIIFRNRSNVPLGVYWVDDQGKEKFHADLRPGQSLQQRTYMTHVWRVRQKGTNVLVTTAVANKKRKLVEISGR